MTGLKILLPTDGITLINETVSTAVKLAKTENGRITVLYVLDSKLLFGTKDLNDQEEGYRLLKRNGQDIVNDIVSKCEGVDVKGMIIEGDPKQAIIDVSREYSYIVLGRTHSGSITDDILTNAKCPVITVGPE